MSDARAELKKLVSTKPDAAHAIAAAAVISQGLENPGDEPSEADVDFDFDFVNLDPTVVQPYYDAQGLKGPDPKMALRWCETDPRMFQRRLTQGWKPAEDGKIKNGTTMLCEMPKTRHDKMKRILAQRASEKENSYMRSFDDEARRKGGRHFTPFDGPRGPRDGLD